ncbi:hypothetical protein MMC30_005574 [Trapelia coarctata]|nr:hypothetical protein [Trapelia coarctata]
MATTHVHLSPRIPALPSEKEIQDKPWKYNGYRTFSQVIASDSDFFVIRRFGALNARVILALQDEISQLEEQLSSLEDIYSSKDHEDVNNGSFRQESKPERATTVRELKIKLKEYNEFVLLHSQVKERPPAHRQEIQNIDNWFYSNPGAICDPETDYINHTDDLITIIPKTKTPLRRGLERFQSFQLSSLFSTTPTNIGFYDPKLIRYHSDVRIEKFITAVVTLCGALMLIAPLWILDAVGTKRAQLEVISVFIVVFLVLVSSITVARPFESLAATAALVPPGLVKGYSLMLSC